tara:strand:- start:1124 stop:2317 length:1194 start_codon:yes stop_codon:yes gene_type:complete
MQQQQQQQQQPPSFAPHGGGVRGGSSTIGDGGERQQVMQQQQQQQQQPSLFIPPNPNPSNTNPLHQHHQQQMQFMPSTFAPPPSSEEVPYNAEPSSSSQQQQHHNQRSSLDGGSGRYQPPPPSQNFQHHQPSSTSSFQQNQPSSSAGGGFGGGWAALFTRTKSFGNVQNTTSSSGAASSGNRGFRGKVSWSGGFPDEPPLLEELGVDFAQIARRAKSAMNPLPMRKKHTRETSKDDDLAGPLVVFGLIATLHALQGKGHYGYILGWSAIASGLTCWLLNQLTAQNNNDAGENLSLSRTASVIGYNATSILFLSVVKAFVHSEGSSNGSKSSSGGGSFSGTTNSFGILAFACVCILQASSKSSGLFLHGMGQCGEGKRLVVFYPMVLLYSLYALLTLY